MKKIICQLLMFLYLLVLPVALWADTTVELHHLRTLKTDFAVTAIGWHPHGEFLAAGGVFSKNVTIWDVNTGREVRTLSGWPSGVGALAYSPDGRYLAVGANFVRASKEGVHLRIYDANSGKLIQEIAPPTARFGGSSDVGVLLFDKDNSRVIVNGYASQSTGVVYQAASGKVIATLDASNPTDVLYSLALSPDGRLLVVGRLSGLIEVWSTAQWKKLTEISAHPVAVYSLAISPDGRYLASASRADGGQLNPTTRQTVASKYPEPIKIWDLSNMTKVRALSTEIIGPLRSLQFASGGNLLLVGGGGKSVEIWDLASKKVARRLEHREAVAYVWANREGTRIATAAAKEIKIWIVE